MENMSPGILCKNKLVMRKTFQLCRTVVSTAGRDGTSREQTSVCGFGDRRLIQGNARGSEQKKKTSMNLSPWSIRFVWARQRQRHRQRERERAGVPLLAFENGFRSLPFTSYKRESQLNLFPKLNIHWMVFFFIFTLSLPPKCSSEEL